MSGGKRREYFGAIAGTRRGLEQVERTLSGVTISNLRDALEAAIRAWGAGLYVSDEDHVDAPDESVLTGFVKSRLEQYSIEAALLERGKAESHAAFGEVPESDLESVLAKFR